MLFWYSVTVNNNNKEMILLHLFKKICSSRFCWFLIFLAGCGLEACGLYFQYKLDLQPCINCVYERAYFLGFVFIGFLGALAGNLLIVRFACSLGFLLSSIGGLIVTFEHYAAYTGMEGYAAKCKLTTNFPSFLPLDDIAPFMFKAFAMCNEKLDWSFLGQSMPFWILVIFLFSTLIAALMFISNFVKDKVNTFVNLYK